MRVARERRFQLFRRVAQVHARLFIQDFRSPIKRAADCQCWPIAYQALQCVADPSNHRQADWALVHDPSVLHRQHCHVSHCICHSLKLFPRLPANQIVRLQIWLIAALHCCRQNFEDLPTARRIDVNQRPEIGSLLACCSRERDGHTIK